MKLSKAEKQFLRHREKPKYAYGPADMHCMKGFTCGWYVVGEREELAGLKSKDLVGIPWRLAFALQADG